jgi:hypothetical protein
VPKPSRPRIRYAVTSIAAHAAIRTDGQSLACPRMLSSRASVPASTVAEEDGTSAVQSCSKAKYAIHAALFRLARVAQDHEIPAVSRVARSLRSWGRNSGMAKAAAAIGM